jgi:hypothetical protein
MDTQRLEGSRFGTSTSRPAMFVAARLWPEIMSTGGSRERLNAPASVYRVETIRTEHRITNITLGNSREPPVATICGGPDAGKNIVRSFVHIPKRLPSRDWAITRRVNSPHSRRRGRVRFGRYRPYSGATAAGTMMASRMPCTIFLSGGTIVAKTPPKTTSRGETTK